MKIKVKVKPNSGRQEIVEVSKDEYVVSLKKQAEDGKANEELLKLLKKHFGKNFKIKSGYTSRNKVLEEI